MNDLRKWICLLLLSLPLLCLSGCQSRESGELKIGYIGGLTGRVANLGIAGRDGVLLAIEQVNAAGGISGRPVRLVAADDKQSNVEAIKAMQKMIAAEVPVVIGPMTSSIAVSLAPLASQQQILMVSPTVSTMLLGKQDDFFFRVYPQCMVVARSLADYVTSERELKRIAVIYDVGNLAFTESWKNCFGERLQQQGGNVVAEVSFESGGAHLFGSLIDQALAKQPDGLLLLANSLDTAMLAQQLYKRARQIPIFTSEWSMTRDLLRSGGRAVEGATLFHTFNEDSEKGRYLDFKEAFEKRFNRTPSFPAIHAYDAVQTVIAAMRQGARSGVEIKRALLGSGTIDTLQSSMEFDAYGDVKRDVFLTVVTDGRFVVKEMIATAQE